MLNLPCRYRLALIIAAEVDRNKFVEYSAVEQQQHTGGIEGVLHCEESLRGVVCLEIAHPGRIGDGAVLLAVGSKGYASVEEDLEPWPYIVDGVGAGTLYHLAEHSQEPRRHSGYVGDVLMQRGFYECRQLFCPVGHKCDVFAGYTQQVGCGVHAVDEIGRQVADFHSRRQVPELVGKAAAENEAFAAEQIGLRIQIEIVCHDVRCPAVVVCPQRIVGDRYELALAVGCAARLCEAPAYPRPQHIALALHHTLHHLAIFRIGGRGNAGRKVVVSRHRAESLAAADLCTGGFAQQMPEHAELCLSRTLGCVPAPARADTPCKPGP